ncbi:MAG TPA: tRNA pseudouridine synthase A [Saprospiraceae bacterium]|nr:tRNA pseudouridine synthase A [Saprospiraceae bacterium]HRO09475.1 tRNA pseudouridine synthase A [Saprospiraceae bacterium]HRP42753.1 tRNA pseudouridine synthase A [Saprospiraceae bacterium]
MRYMLHLAYVGTRYTGWQRQATQYDNVQSVLEKHLSGILGHHTTLNGCGRTDAGVHAIQYFAHFDTDRTLDFDVVARCNHILPQDIRIYDIIPVHELAHARFDAIERSYIYHIHTHPNPYTQPYSTWYLADYLNIGIMQEGLAALVKMHDFRYLCRTPDRVGNTVCSLTEAALYYDAIQSTLLFRFTANRFLKSMIRMMVARIIELGTKRISMDIFLDINEGRARLPYPTVAYPQGLHLYKIRYPYLDLEPKNIPFDHIENCGIKK